MYYNANLGAVATFIHSRATHHVSCPQKTIGSQYNNNYKEHHLHLFRIESTGLEKMNMGCVEDEQILMSQQIHE